MVISVYNWYFFVGMQHLLGAILEWCFLASCAIMSSVIERFVCTVLYEV